MFRFLLLVALIVIAVVLGLRAHHRLQEFALVDLAPGAGVVLHHAWAVLVELWPASGILAAAVLLLAAAAAGRRADGTALLVRDLLASRNAREPLLSRLVTHLKLTIDLRSQIYALFASRTQHYI